MPVPQTLPPALLTIAAAAEYLSVSRRTLEYLIRDGEVRKINVGKRAPRIARGELDAYVDRLQRMPA